MFYAYVAACIILGLLAVRQATREKTSGHRIFFFLIGALFFTMGKVFLGPP
jgi:hypothetical protein